ncbi:helix-turn-helix transcriptional regulator [Aeromonas jandaei]|uniref:helix-turn-helix transcriptional regulator n=1 Tax=Aeromonas jandaei TaxID=650 RepID=UPI003B9E2727
MQEHKHDFRLLKIREVISIVGLSKPTIYLKIKEGTFPRQVTLGPKSVAWIEGEINDWITEKMAERNI